MFGNTTESPQTERTPFRPRSPYGISKVAGFHLTTNYRDAYGLFASNGILFNHESERRGYEFVTKKIVSGVAKVKLGLAEELTLGNLDAKRDWGFAPDYVLAMWQILQQPEPDDYVVATGVSHSVRELAEKAFDVVGLDWNEFVRVDDRLFRPAEIFELRGDASKAKSRLGWKPSITFDEMIEMMIKTELQRLKSADASP
jgi:GDPmannose 4,6-dehydratase